MRSDSPDCEASVPTVAVPSLPFGAIGESGSTRHHGIKGVREVSNLRGDLVHGEGGRIEAFAPIRPTGQPGTDAALAGAA